MGLASLAPDFVTKQHQPYLVRLTTALGDKRNRNIALTGRYGAGKSSVLDEYVKNHKKTTLRLAISSLGPNDEGASLTNRIQKEIVKQLIYSAKPRTLARSQFHRPVDLPWWRAAGEVGVVLALVGVFLKLMGWLPTPSAARSGDPRLVWVAVAGLLVAAGTGLRLLTHEKFFVSDVSAGGATVKLSEKKLTYFDQYLDLIVNFFDSENIDVVVFEDLDRFNDPQIFEALRELNTLLNGSNRGKSRTGPLRFVYAVRDSLFEKIGTKPTSAPAGQAEAGEDTENPTPTLPKHASEVDDAAKAETARANRTKFFEVVIPVVPFISHRNARDLLKGLLEKADVSVERGLVDLVAHHCTDMRLLRNMCNEYLVFAERLLEGEKRAPGLNASKLFALVAYKNFHMEDFENIARRTSALDTLYDDRRGLIRHGVTGREGEKRDLLRLQASPPSVQPFAQQLGTTLNAAAQLIRKQQGHPNSEIFYRVGDNTYTSADAATAQFWSDVVAAAALTVVVKTSGLSVALAQDDLEVLFPRVLEGRWRERNLEAANTDAAKLDVVIADLRGADFSRLVEASDTYRLPSNFAGIGGPGTVAWAAAAQSPATESVSMADRVHAVLGSELARDLVRRGFIDLNFSVYAAQFYGSFAGIDVHTFLMQAEQTNSVDIDYKFQSADAVTNLLEEAGVEFTRSISAFNTDVLDWLLHNEHPGAADVVLHLMRTLDSSDVAQQFMATYLTSGDACPQLVAFLAHEEWRPTFTHLSTSTDVPEDVRIDLVDAALRAASALDVYDTPGDVANFLISHYQHMSAFTEPQPTGTVVAVVALVRRAEILLPDLAGIDSSIRQRVVEDDLYELSPGNLRLAAGIEGPIDLDHLRAAAPGTVYGYCLRHLDTYLVAVDGDSRTTCALGNSETLIDTLNTETATEWSSPQQQALFNAISADAVLHHLQTVPSATWETLAEAGLFYPSLTNVEAYLTQIGSIDTGLGNLLMSAGAITTDPPPAAATETEEAPVPPGLRKVAVAVLNARKTIPSPQHRVQLVESLGLRTPLAVTDIVAEESDLFARLLQARLVADDEATFTHLAAGGWTAVRPAIMASEQVPTYLTPAHVSGMVSDVLKDLDTADVVGKRVLKDLDAFVATEGQATWNAVASYAWRTRAVLSWPHLQQVAANSAESALLTMQLLDLAQPNPEDVHEVLAVLTSLGAPWSYLSTKEDDHFDMPDEQPFTTIFQLLASQNIVKVGRRKKDGNRTVSLQ